MALGLAMVFVLAGTIRTTAVSAAAVTLEPTSVTDGYTVKAGHSFIIHATNFKANDSVSTWASYSLRPTQYATAGGQADSSGNVSIEIKTGRFWEPGWWAITVSTYNFKRSGIVRFKIEAVPPDGGLDVAPARDMHGGERINFHGIGFNQGETIQIWATRPDGSADPIDDGVVQSGGGVNFYYDIPAGALTGRWSVTVYGQSSERLLVQSFNVIP